MTSVCADAMPICDADNTPVVSGTNNSVTCRLNYTRFSDLSPVATLTSSVTWPNGESGKFRSTDYQRTGTVSATVQDVAVTKEGIPAISWTVHFTFRVQTTSGNKNYAVNNDAWSWTSNIIPVWSELRFSPTVSSVARKYYGVLRSFGPSQLMTCFTTLLTWK